MGVADNRSYKNEYHFTEKSSANTGDIPSVYHEPRINTTVKDNPYRANVEIEKDEIVLEPNLSALFKAVGKTHKQGGVDVLLKPDSFVFSNDKMLSFSENEHELFELKKGGTWSPKKNTPAMVLKRNVDMKHYNRVVKNLTDVGQDDTAKKSSGMMLEKYIQSLGNIAYLQEAKKDFPTGVPSFAEGTAPVYDTDLKNDIMKQKQFAKYGGNINPYAVGGSFAEEDPCPCGRDKNGNCLHCPDEIYQKILDKARKVDKALPGYNPLYDTPTATLYGKFGTDPMTGKMNVPLSIPGGNPGQPWRNKIQSLIDKGATLDNLVKQGHGTREGLSRMFKFSAGTQGTPDDYIYTPKGTQPPPGFNPPPRIQDSTPQVPNIEGNAQGVKTADWQFTPWQKASQMYNLGKLAGAKRYMPFRSRFNASYVDPSLLNPEQTIGDLKGAANQQLSSLGTLNPIMRNAQASSIYGNLLDKIPGVRSQYDNANAEIMNQTRSNNNQIRNNETGMNMKNDQQYYEQVINGLQNFDNMKSSLSDNFMNNLLGDVQSNQTLAYGLLTQKNPAYGFDWKSGNFTRNKKSILDASINPQADFVSSLLSQLIPKFDSLDPRVQAALLKTAAVKGLPMLPNSSFKKGGKVNPYKY